MQENIDHITLKNNYFRRVIYTSRHAQLVVMCLKAYEEIGEEVHNVDQFFKIEGGEGLVVINGKQSKIRKGEAILIPAGTKHNIINTTAENLKLYTIYSPPQHKDGTIHKTKNDAEIDKEHFDGKLTETT